ncbi:MAG: hypothetical protein F4X31_04395 [Gammaproteobacteria bacterium]|nr:hypothetical protein [Gammaproteobacteria bacterium]
MAAWGALEAHPFNAKQQTTSQQASQGRRREGRIIRKLSSIMWKSSRNHWIAALNLTAALFIIRAHRQAGRFCFGHRLKVGKLP